MSVEFLTRHQVMSGMVGVSRWTWPVDRDASSSTAIAPTTQGARKMGDDEMNDKRPGLASALGPGLGLAPEQTQTLAPVLMQALRALSCLVGDGFDLKLQSNHALSMTHNMSNTMALTGGFGGGGGASSEGVDSTLPDGPFFSLCVLLSQIASMYPHEEELQLVLLPLLLVILASSMPCKIHCIDLGILPNHITQLLEEGKFRSSLHTQAQECLTQLALSSSEQAVMPLTTHPLMEGDALTACMRVMELAELYEQRRPLGE